MLDPGHGGDDPGAINDAAGLVERELVLDIARRTKARLEEAGYSAALTRNDNATDYANTPRGVIANACHASVYVSIHLNSFGEPEPNYAKTFWGIEEKDAAFASVMQAALVTRLQPGTDLGDSGLEVLENGGLMTARMPAVLVEPVFLSNPEEAARLADPAGERREAIAAAITDGVDAWLRSKRLGPLDVAGIPGRTPGLIMTAEDPLLAAPRGSAVRALASALRAEARRPEDLRAYLMEVYRLAPLVGIDPAIVVAQSAHETGWWQSPAWTDHLNPAGIGITGSGRRLTILGERSSGGARSPGASLPLCGRADSPGPSPGAIHPARPPLRRGPGRGAREKRHQPGGPDRALGDRPGLRGTRCPGRNPSLRRAIVHHQRDRETRSLHMKLEV